MRKNEKKKKLSYVILLIFITIILGVLAYQQSSFSGDVLLIQTDPLPLKYPYYFCFGSSTLDFDKQETVTMLNCPQDDPKGERCLSYEYIDSCTDSFTLKKFHCIDERTRGLKFVDCRREGSRCVDGECIS